MIRFRRSSHLDEAKWLDVFHWIFVENGLSIFIYLVKSSVGQCVCIWQKLCLGGFFCRGNIAIQFNQHSNNFPERLASTENNTSRETVQCKFMFSTTLRHSLTASKRNHTFFRRTFRSRDSGRPIHTTPCLPTETYFSRDHRKSCFHIFPRKNLHRQVTEVASTNGLAASIASAKTAETTSAVLSRLQALVQCDFCIPFTC